MANRLLENLYGASFQTRLDRPSLAEDIARLFENADSTESVVMEFSRKPLVDALKALGVSTSPDTKSAWMEIQLEDGDAYAEATNVIFTPDGMYELAKAGWVPSRTGDRGMSGEPAEFKIYFTDLNTAQESTTDKVPDLEKIIKQGRENATTPSKPSELNPVKKSTSVPDGEKQKGIGKASDGNDPEGKPKGSHKNESEQVSDIVNSLLEMTSVAAIPVVGEAPMNFGSEHKPKRRRRLMTDTARKLRTGKK